MWKRKVHHKIHRPSAHMVLLLGMSMVWFREKEDFSLLGQRPLKSLGPPRGYLASLQTALLYCQAVDLAAWQTVLRPAGPIDILMTFHKHGTAWDSMVKKSSNPQVDGGHQKERSFFQKQLAGPSPGYSPGGHATFWVAQTKVCYTYSGQPGS